VLLEAAPVVHNPQEKPALSGVQNDPDPARSGVLQNVGDGFLRDP